ncbi:MAG: hypothetical protein RLZZ414_2034 [Bacteroidota bacterium]|jgi:CRISPR-associated protein Cpf1
MQKSLENFTGLYSLSKTLKFELKPIGKNGKPLKEQESDQIFKKIIDQDKRIKQAYLALKPVLDKIHEDIINKSLSSEAAKKIDFFSYFEEYKKGKDRNLDALEYTLRNELGKAFEKTANNFAENASDDEKGKPIFKKNKDKHEGVKYLTQSGILKYIEKNVKEFVPENEIKEFVEAKEIINEQGKKEIERTGHLAVLNSFFTYFSGFNQNRENYYVTKEEKATAVATRIVHENLPKFCDNAIQFYSSRKEEYLGALEFLKNNNRITKIKDAQTNTMIEAKAIVEDCFKIERFPYCLAQAEIEGYNKVIGHYNLLINLYNQAKKADDKSFKNLPPFKTLYKQIGCGEKKALFFELKFDTKEEQQKANEYSDSPLNLQETIELISEASKKYFQKSTNDSDVTIYSFIDWLKNNTDWNGVYWSKAAVDKVSNKYFANWHEIKDRIQSTLGSKDKAQKELLSSVASFDKKREEQLKIYDAVELSGLFSVLNQPTETGWSKVFFKESILSDRSSLIDEKLSPSENVINLICADLEDLATEFLSKSDAVLKITDYKHKDNVLVIKEWLDTAKYVLWLIKYFEVKAGKVKGNNINPELTVLLDSILRTKDADWLDWYDVVRNYLTKKPQDDAKKNKLKLNFESSSFLNGLSQDFDAKAGLIFEKDGLYYLTINYKLSKEDIIELKKVNGETVKRIIIDFQKPDNKNTPRLFIRSKGDDFAPAVTKYNLPINDIIEIYDTGKFKTEYRKKNEQEYNDSLKKVIDYFKQGFLNHDSYKHYNFAWKETAEYKDISDFYHDTEVSCYQIKEEQNSWKNLMRFVEEEKVFLFQIYNKDFSKEKNIGGKDNIHSYYWKSLFIKSAVNKFGTQGAEIFFREKSIEYKPKFDNGREEGHHYKELKDKFKYPIVSNRRFTANKFLFHCPIILNFKSNEKREVSEIVNDNFTQTTDIQFLGIDRGEKHLIYYSLLNANGEIIEQNHLDIINKKDYLKAINDAAELRRKKQENWQQKGNIANLKDGYISLVVHEVIQKMKDENGNFKPTFIVLEDLNTGFKRSRQKFEQSVYQKFELALAKKLNYLVDKNANNGEIGSVTKALQLTPLVSNFGDIENRKQVGVMLYCRANYTSVTDPVTGWRKTIYLKKGSEEAIKNEILKIFDKIGVDENGDYFFEYKDENTQKTWTLWSGKNGKSLERYRAKRGKDKNEFIIEAIDLKTLLDQLFVNFDKSKSLKKQIEEGKELPKINEHTAWETLRFVIDTIQQIRNSGDVSKGQSDNFLLSPARDEQGNHFDSRLYEKQENPKLPKDADANGAYNIARKGIVMYNHIHQWVKDGKPKFEKGTDLDLFISDKEWDLWLSDKEKWQSELKTFSSKKSKKKQ